jgi:hypothetical protein
MSGLLQNILSGYHARSVKHENPFSLPSKKACLPGKYIIKGKSDHLLFPVYEFLVTISRCFLTIFQGILT